MSRVLNDGHAPETAEPDVVRAVVTKVCDSYVVTYPISNSGDLTTFDSVTFSLAGWKDDEFEPEPGQIVDLIDVYLRQSGWRADSARPVKPTTQSQQTASRRAS